MLFVGRLLGDKGVRELVEAARLLKSAGHPSVFRSSAFWACRTGRPSRRKNSKAGGPRTCSIISERRTTSDPRSRRRMRHPAILSRRPAALVARSCGDGASAACQRRPGGPRCGRGWHQRLALPRPLGRRAGGGRATVSLLDAGGTANNGDHARRTAEQRFSELQVIAAYRREISYLLGSMQQRER